MITNCKICDKEFKPGTQWCSICKYSLVVKTQRRVIEQEDGNTKVEEDKFIESEMIASGNMHFIYYPLFKEGNVVSTEERHDFKILHRVEMEELTGDLAKYWVKRLKSFLVFQ